MPSQKQIRWAELRVGITVLVAVITITLLIFLMSSTSSVFAKQIHIKAYFDNAEGLRIGAPVQLQGVDIGNVTDISVEPNKPSTPVKVTMKVNTRYRDFLKEDSTAALSTAGVLGQTFVDINSSQAKGAPAKEGDVLQVTSSPNLQDVVRASQTSLQNVDVLVRRVDRIVAAIEEGKGSIGKAIYDPSLYNRLNATLNQVQGIVNTINSGQGSLGKLIKDEELYNKANASLDRLNQIVDAINAGQGTVGKLLKDPSLYNNANQTIAKANDLLQDINEGKGALGKIATDQAFAKKLDQTVTNLQLLTTRMQNGEGTIGQVFTNKSLYNNADQMLVETRSLIKAIRENPKKYLTIHFKIF